ncbi:hypothetical protein BH10BAC2_BH10BAC2_20910 [soil metagenome]
MKKITFLILACTIIVTACTKNTGHQATTNIAINAVNSEGTITGMDGRKCACCWGWLIEIDGKQYKFDKIPESSSFNLNNISYPANVNIKWKDAEGDCSGKLIEVLSISPL